MKTSEAHASAYLARKGRGAIRRFIGPVREAARRVAATRDAETEIGWPEERPEIVRLALDRAGIPVSDWRVPADGYHLYMNASEYPATYLGGDHGRDPLFLQKSLEHYSSLALLDLELKGASITMIDVASHVSPFADIVRRLRGWTVYRQDLQVPPGVSSELIGGDAAAMPVGDSFAEAMTLHCSFDHFEGDSDIGFVREAGRVLRPGGRVVIVPLYLSTEFSLKADPRVSWRGVRLDNGMRRYLIPGLDVRFSRLYDAPRLKSRVLETAERSGLRWGVHRVLGGHELVPRSYLNFALVIDKPS